MAGLSISDAISFLLCVVFQIDFMPKADICSYSHVSLYNIVCC